MLWRSCSFGYVSQVLSCAQADDILGGCWGWPTQNPGSGLRQGRVVCQPVFPCSYSQGEPSNTALVISPLVLMSEGPVLLSSPRGWLSHTRSTVLLRQGIGAAVVGKGQLSCSYGLRASSPTYLRD